MMPLWTRAMRPELSRWGWALVWVGAPWVAHRVWAMPTWPAGRDLPLFSSFSSALIRPTARRTCISPAESMTAMPAESYPLYSSRLSPSIRRGCATLRPTYATIPHMLCDPVEDALMARHRQREAADDERPL